MEKEKCPDCNVIIEKCLFCWDKEVKKILRGKLWKIKTNKAH